ncbi:hypothetical protein KUTeg_002985 [Tegillarca granosa]|uniref:Uncharacterized protein n=1 Tax=Tegillarca granosa TaxID=220873 RepID=A0ABQ9FKT8_TEGGR|nr:hypothetical protein KUTeg_002985 [Tegillarca granosa]
MNGHMPLCLHWHLTEMMYKFMVMIVFYFQMMKQHKEMMKERSEETEEERVFIIKHTSLTVRSRVLYRGG